MKTLIAAMAFALTATVSAQTAAMSHDGHAGNSHGSMKSAADSPLAEGVVKKIDKTTGKVTVSHGPLTNLDMPAMTMVFRVKDAAWLDQMQAGSKIRFVADNVNNALTIVRFEPAK